MHRKLNRIAILVVVMIACSLFSGLADEALVNINTADEATLITLTYIGKSKAQAIIAHREEHGPFKSIEEVKAVSGVGERIYDTIKDKITVDNK